MRRRGVCITIPVLTFFPLSTVNPLTCASELYPDPHVFDGFRFDKLRQAEETGAAKYHAVTTSLDYLAFGHGVHSWTAYGRYCGFLPSCHASIPSLIRRIKELKAIVAHIVLNYDIKVANGEGRPANQYIASACLPHASAKVLFRKRQN
jgi:hypothetical protein